jgi:hypothetical protein
MNVTFSSSSFTYYKPTRTFVSEMSDLQLSQRPDVITIVSSKTGVGVDFQYVGRLEEKEQFDGELVGYEYVSPGGSFFLHILND